MTVRNDIDITIYAGKFQEFDHGKQIEQTFPGHFSLKINEVVWWNCAQFHGLAKIIGSRADREKHFCTLEKIY